MAAGTMNGGGRGGSWIRIALWGAAAGLLALPAVAMRFTAEVDWTASDFLFAAVMLGSVGLLAEAAVRMSGNWSYRAGAAVALAAGFATVWANAAVGMIGDGDNPFNLIFLGIVAAALVGAMLVRRRPSALAKVMTAAAAAQLGVSLAGYSVDPKGAIFSSAFALVWLLSCVLFARAARDRTEA